MFKQKTAYEMRISDWSSDVCSSDLVYYYLAYNKLPPLFQAGANDGFHEAIGDTIVLAMTPEYLHSIGLVGEQQQGHDALINSQMRMALAKVAFLPFGLMIDRWRWGVFDGSIEPSEYNTAWWQLKAEYQGVAPVEPRGEEFFDPGAKDPVPAKDRKSVGTGKRVDSREDLGG